MYILSHFSSYYHFIHNMEWKKVKNQIVVWQTNLSNPLSIDQMKFYTFYSFIKNFDLMGEYNQPKAHFSPRKVKKQKSRGYDIPPPNMEPLPTFSGHRRAHPPPGCRRARPYLGAGVRTPPRMQAWAPPAPRGHRRVRPLTTVRT
jgi:hypothetical protein